MNSMLRRHPLPATSSPYKQARRKLTQLISIRIFPLLLIICVCACNTLRGQVNNVNAHAAFAEKIYLQTDGTVYTTDNTIWFKAIVTDATDHLPSTLSGVLYVELIDPTEKIIEKKLVKLVQGIGEGSIQLNPQHLAGTYLLRAYTTWNKNFGQDFFYQQYLQVFSATSKPIANAIPNVTLVKDASNHQRLTATFNPLVIDSLHTKALTVIIATEGKKDTFTLKKNNADEYLLDFELAPQCQLITLHMRTRNDISFSKTIVLDTNYVDLQFFPESGELVHGLAARVAFKAAGANGRGKRIEGTIVNQLGTVVTHFSTNAQGMGSVMLPSPDSSVQLFAVLNPITPGILKKSYALPLVAPMGNMITITKSATGIQIKAHSNYLLNDSITIRAACRGIIYLDVKGALKNGFLGFTLAANRLPQGIIAFTMLADSTGPVAERLYFNTHPSGNLSIAVTADKASYPQRGLTQLTIQTSDHNGQPKAANLSLLVVNKAQLGKLQDQRQQLVSYLLLSSELKGPIEDAGWYFAQPGQRDEDLDLLLITQGWRQYQYTRPPTAFAFAPERKLSVTGTVADIMFKKKLQKGATLTMMTFGTGTSVQEQKTDSLGRFQFLVDDEYGDQLNIVIQSANKSGSKKDYTITLDKKEIPPIHFYQAKTVEQPDSIIYNLVTKNRERKQVQDAAQKASGLLLEEVVLKSYIMTPERKKVTDAYGKAETVIEGQAIRDKEAKWSYGLYSVLLFNFPEQVRIYRDSAGILQARLMNPEPTLVVIDGVPVYPEQYSIIPNIPPSEVMSFELIPYADNFMNLYCTVYPLNCVQPPPWGNVIAIYTYGKKGLFGASRTVGIVKTAVPVFSAVRQFEAPKYDTPVAVKPAQPDRRSLIHWQPVLQTNSTGKATVSFYNADVTGTMQVVVEAIAPDGTLGYHQTGYEVKKTIPPPAVPPAPSSAGLEFPR